MDCRLNIKDCCGLALRVKVGRDNRFDCGQVVTGAAVLGRLINRLISCED